MKYEYLKGSAEDFDGAPEWAIYLAKLPGHGCSAWVSGCDDHYRYVASGREFNGIFLSVSWLGGMNLIAQRRPITDESDLNECIGQPAESDSVESLIAERGKRYGKFSDGAEIMRDLKSVMHSTDGWERLSNSQQEALDMIQHKIGRVLNGDPNYDDNWKDIAGYATLVVDELNDK